MFHWQLEPVMTLPSSKNTLLSVFLPWANFHALAALC